MSVQVSYKKQFALYFIFLLLILVVVEGLARFWEFFLNSCSLGESDSTKTEHYNYFQVRQMCLDYRSLAFVEPDIIQIKPNQHFPSVNVNSDGFRGPEIILEKPESTYRIFVVGGSTTMGHGSSSDETTMPGFLQKRFDDENLDVNIEVINAGINSLYSFSETYHIKKNILKYNPDLIINYGGVNDANKWTENPRIKTEEEVKEDYGGFKFKNFQFYRTPFVAYTLLFAADWKEQEYGERTNPTDKVIPAWKDRWLDICELGKTQGFKTMIVVQPALGTGNKNFYSSDEFENLPRTEHELRFIHNLEMMANELDNMSGTCDYVADLRNVFDNIEEPLFYDHAHVNDQGNEIVADEIFEFTLPTVLEEIKN